MQSTPADAVFILGDLFEVWVGDDAFDYPAASPHTSADQLEELPISFEKRCVEVLKTASQRLPIFVMHGNRDFLLSCAFEEASGAKLLNDPTCLAFAGERWLLSHGDALCLGDTDYLAFRAEVRSTDWKHNFLARPMQDRQALARSLRQQSKLRKANGMGFADVDDAEAARWLIAHQASTLIHGHTHKPADHDLSVYQTGNIKTQRLQRIVLSDWDCTATPRRAEILRLGVKHPARRITA
jgi:UDP-2,3-diacylglucosamine hydrolase